MLRYDASRLRAFRVVSTIVGCALALQSLQSIGDPDPSAPSAPWRAVPLALALAAVALAWRKRPALPWVTLALFAAAATQAFTLFGDSLFARIAAGAIVAVLGLCLAWACLALPLLAWRRGRWPVKPVAYAPFAPGDDMPQDVRERIASLAAVGFTPRLVHARSEGRAAARIVVLVHDKVDAVATVTHIVLDGNAFSSTRLRPAPRDAASLSILDAAPPAPFPPSPVQRLLLFPDADARTLLDHYVSLHGTVPPKPVPDDQLAAAMAAVSSSYERWLVDAGYLANDVHDDERRYTLKGGFSAVLRVLWPWSALERARLARNGREALRGASGAGAA